MNLVNSIMYLKLEEKNFAVCNSVDLKDYNIRDFKVRSFIIYSIEQKNQMLYLHKPFKKISLHTESIQYIAVEKSAKNYRIMIHILTNQVWVIFNSSLKIKVYYLLLILLKIGVPQITTISAYSYAKHMKLKKFFMN